MSERTEAFVTLATNDSYATGAFVLASSLRNVKTTRQLVVLITQQVSHQYRHRLRHVFDIVKLVDPFDSGDEKHLRLLGRPELGITLTKLHCWRLIEFSKAVFMDADTLVMHNIDDLFTRPELSAAPDVGWPDCFNSGVFVYIPSMKTYDKILSFALQFGSFDGGDQGLLNDFFNTWATDDINTHLSFTYNMTATTAYWYAPALERFSKDIKVVHFIGAVKPWHYFYDRHTGRLELNQSSQDGQQFISNYLLRWWEIYTAAVDKLPAGLRDLSEEFWSNQSSQHSRESVGLDMAVKRYAEIQQRMEMIMLANRPPLSIKSPIHLTSPSSLSDDDSVKQSFSYAEIQRKMNETITKGNIQHGKGKVLPQSQLIEPGMKDSSTSSQSAQQGASIQDSKNIEFTSLHGSAIKSTETQVSVSDDKSTASKPISTLDVKIQEASKSLN